MSVSTPASEQIVTEGKRHIAAVQLSRQRAERRQELRLAELHNKAKARRKHERQNRKRGRQ